ncbi:MAG: hypothetical protein A3C43_03280 [Candidatus Schekmanbacteria bacterium RIFCSPHIGHO2_02_FULL_38_11]|uniref:DUF362 domain-containing protein n=1 Tax=Candidatus Schekmanbacteria bacterium RIFCSPLOWO2_12_FULL_38_15 TaxID=1817883 RepID=A0A1F7SN73_9BACT|nr:MAG: hypothetical protein A2043_03045 [Candidatus Schekmanbacteria bacterium GWA2_38_9]OGL50114.1 MAG: hypothetical protein A3H37_07365 [Candidatus Schekmanbacteria bacterium RIFCSPLOWO2_02_FULL_38_14]OGL54300.1 MAG: hypothetical protein A3C43_03280 [Candidatus Schekmanbacteria bacterium RIFCSPHIGHO2_02_FULL_38_11]OGL55225.1 MAG: hypothetical protein A3G31_09660 [Candidatus Schekmanbacteria bacterium RIFCSPLOWO2_12_FULL_38_15]
MLNKKKRISRRSFIKAAGFATASIPLSSALKNSVTNAFAETAKQSAITISDVFTITHSKVMNEAGKISPAIAREMVDKAVISLTGEKNIKDAWHNIFPNLKEKEIIGFKVNVTNHQLPTHPEVAYAIADSLSESGIKKNNILIWDKLDRSLEKAGYIINDGNDGYRCFGHNHNNIGYDKNTKVKIPSVDLELYLSKLLTQYCDYIINVPVLKNCLNQSSSGASKAGVTLSLKSAYGYIPLGDGPFFFKPDEVNAGIVIQKMHNHTANPQIAELNLHPQIKNKTKLVLCDAIMGICENGPFGPPQFINNQIIASRDLVAHDAVGLSIIDKKAKEMGKTLAAEFALHIKAAQDLGLGNSDLKNIKLTNFSIG